VREVVQLHHGRVYASSPGVAGRALHDRAAGRRRRGGGPPL